MGGGVGVGGGEEMVWARRALCAPSCWLVGGGGGGGEWRRARLCFVRERERRECGYRNQKKWNEGRERSRKPRALSHNHHSLRPPPPRPSLLPPSLPPSLPPHTYTRTRCPAPPPTRRPRPRPRSSRPLPLLPLPLPLLNPPTTAAGALPPPPPASSPRPGRPAPTAPAPILRRGRPSRPAPWSCARPARSEGKERGRRGTRRARPQPRALPLLLLSSPLVSIPSSPPPGHGHARGVPGQGDRLPPDRRDGGVRGALVLLRGEREMR